MTIDLDHLIVPARDKIAAAKQLAEILDVPWSTQGTGPFAPVFVSDRLTIDFDQHEGSFPILHYCFRVSEDAFDAILARLQNMGIAYRSGPHGPADMRINTAMGGRAVYWDQPAGHVWEMLTVSYDRQPK